MMDFPFIGGRVKPDMLTANIAKTLGLKLNVRETASPTKAWQEVKTSAMLVERTGTGGALFRNRYRDFLKEMFKITKVEIIGAAHQEFKIIAELWSEEIGLFDEVASTSDRQYVLNASQNSLRYLSGKNMPCSY